MGVRWNAVASTIKLTLSGVFLFAQGRDENGIVICQQRHTRFIFRIFHPRGWNRDIPCLYRIEKVMTPAGNVVCQILSAYCRRNPRCRRNYARNLIIVSTSLTYNYQQKLTKSGLFATVKQLITGPTMLHQP